MNKKYFLTVFCIFLVVSMPMVFAAINSGGSSNSLQNINSGNVLGSGTDQNLGEAIIVNVDAVRPPHVRASLLEQQDAMVFAQLRGTTVCTLLSQFSDNACLSDPISGIANIPPIDAIIIEPNISANNYSNHIRNVRYIPPPANRYSLNNLGQVIVQLKKIDHENETPENNLVDVDLNARIYLKIQDNPLLGITQQDLTVKQYSDEAEFLEKKEETSFFSGKGYARATRITGDSVSLQLYNKNLYPIALQTSTQPSLSASDIRRNALLNLRKGETSAPISFGYTGNPLNDFFRVRLDDVSVPSDKAEIEYQAAGRKITRKISVGNAIFSGSNWVLKSVNNEVREERIIAANLDQIVQRFNLNSRQRNQIVSMINNNENPTVETHRIELENEYTGETKTITRQLITKNGERILSDYVVIDSDTVRFLQEKYCPSNSNDIACESIKRYSTIINQHPTTPEAAQAKRDLVDIYADYLIDYSACRKKADGTPIDPQLCRTFQRDMNDLALFYATQIGEQDRIIDNLGGIGGEDYLETEGIYINFKRVITAREDQPKVFLRIYDQSANGQYKDIDSPLVEGDVLSLSKNGQQTIVNYRDDGHKYVWKMTKPSPSSVNIRLYKLIENPGEEDKYISTSTTRTLKLHQRNSLEIKFAKLNAQGQQETESEFVDVELTKIDSRYEAYLTIIPGAGRAFTTSSFQIHIPVDPRPFKWTPDQLNDQIAATKKLIADLDKVINKLDTYISTLKKLCLGVFAFLTIKNSFTGVRNLARREVSEHFKLRCQKEVGEGGTSSHPGFDTIDSCISHYSGEISSSTTRTEDIMDNINDRIEGKTADELAGENFASPEEISKCGEFKAFKEAGESSGVDAREIVRRYRDCMLYSTIQNQSSFSRQYRQYAATKSNEVDALIMVNNYDEAVRIAARPNDNFDENNPEDVRLILSDLQSRRSPSVNTNLLNAVKLTNPAQGQWEGSALLVDSNGNSNPADIKGLSQYDLIVLEERGDANAINENICENYLVNAEWQNSNCIRNRNPITNQLNNKIELLKLQPGYRSNTLQQAYVSKQFYTDTSGGMTQLNQAQCQGRDDREWNSPVIGNSYCGPVIYYSTAGLNSADRVINTGYLNNELTAEYDEEGLPYCYPTGNGEYVIVLKRYPSNKIIEKLRVMNVGANGRMECGRGDDNPIPGGDESALDENPSKKNEYTRKEPRDRCTQRGDAGTKKPGDVVGRVDGKLVKCSIQTRESANILTQPKCIDVMDPTDCLWLFNFCDPVMCPSSRCTLGGKVPPRDVIQSGIIGSLILCAPNIQEGIAVPVCLTGISAGLKNVRSILQGYSDCLEINLKKGDNVGICDYIRSVGICEMVWREAYNLLDIGGRGIIDWVSGSVIGVPEGGGEYLSFQNSLQNVGDSVRVFTNEYSTTYTAQFLSQSSEEIGTQICRLSVNGKLPSVGKILDQLTQPENPPQFTAFFDETPYAAPGGVPPGLNIPSGTQELSLYHVFYHIYAGTGFYQGSYSQPQSLFGPSGLSGTSQQPIVYSVYLINRQAGLQPIYVTTPKSVGQTQRRIEPGKYAQESVQIDGPPGYNEICVNINGNEQCGFGKVDTNFGISEIRDLITSSEASRNEINSSEDCLSDPQNSREYSAARLGALGASQIAAGSGIGGILTPQPRAIGTGVVTSGIVETNLYTRGIVRICSAGEPTQQTSRWEKVGSCGADENGKSRGECWLDLDSVPINNQNIRSDLQSELRERADPSLRIIDPDSSRQALNELNQRRNNIIDSARRGVSR